MILRLTIVTFQDPQECFKYFDIVSESSNRATTEHGAGFIVYIESLYREGLSSLLLLEENYKLVSKGINFHRYSPYLEIYNEMLGWVNAYGLMNRWWNSGKTKNVITDIGPQVLTLDHLGIGFLACCIPIILSFAAYLVNWFGQNCWEIHLKIFVQSFWENFSSKQLNMECFR